jgi:hypothetical protein
MWLSPAIRRHLLSGAVLGVLALVWLNPAPPAAGQSARSYSLPHQEHLTFWANHNGLEQIEVEGEVGFGDMARILLRRRANAEVIRPLRDRFTFRRQDLRDLTTPDVFCVEVTADGARWRNRPERFTAAAGRTFNLPLIVDNHSGAPVSVEAVLRAGSMESAFKGAELAAGQAGGYFLRFVEPGAGHTRAAISLKFGDRRVDTEVAFDVRPLATIRFKLVDDQGHPAAARVYLTGSDGLAYAPRGSISRITAMSAEYFFHAEDEFEIELPAGETAIEATRGLEYESTRRTLDLQAGVDTEVRIPLERWANLAARGWFSSDAHIHANYTAPHHQVISPRDVRLMAVAEDLNNANLMVANSGGAFVHDLQYFEGKPHRLSAGNYLLYWNEEMRNRGLYGHMSFFNLKSLVHPIYTGWVDTPNAEDYPPNYTQAAAARRQGGAVTYVHPASQPKVEEASARELPIDVALGEVEALDVMSNQDEFVAMELWYRLLNCGFRVGISAGSDAFTNVADHYIPGGGRVYVRTGQKMDYARWIEGYTQGRSFASNGPMVSLTVADREPGGEIRLSGPGRKVRVRAEVNSRVPVERFEVVVNGSVAISRSVPGGSLKIDEEVAIERSAWIAARATGPWHRMILNDTHAFAHTSPVYVSVNGENIAFRSDALFYVDWIDKLIALVEKRGRFSAEAKRSEVVELFRKAREIYARIAATGRT